MPSNTVTFERVKPLAQRRPPGLDRDALMLMGAAVRSVQTAGALEAILAMSVAYANERVAFERPIGKFQAVQQNLARLAGEVAAALAVVRLGRRRDRAARHDSTTRVFLEAASAKIRCAEAAAEGAAIAHQVFGAIGFTKEHVLHRFTLRMLAWRDDFGNESYWAAELGKRVARARRRRILAAGGVAMTQRDLQFDPDPPAARMRGAARGGARVPRRGDRRRHLRSAPARPRRLAQPRLQPSASAPRAGSA